MTRKRPTIADVRAMKGKYQYTMLRIESMEEAEAAEQAGIDMASVSPELMCNPQFRDAAPGLFAVPGLDYFEVGTADDFVRWAFRMVKASADAIYCSASLKTVQRLSEEAVPVIGHVGLIPSKRTWTGGFKAVGKTADSAMQIFNAVKAYESAGAFGTEIEVVPSEVATEISRRTTLFMVSMGAGRVAMRNIFLPRMCLAAIGDIIPGMPSATAISRRNMRACKGNASRHLRNFPGM